MNTESEARMQEAYNRYYGPCQDTMFVFRAAWQAQEEFWQKKCEELEEKRHYHMDQINKLASFLKHFDTSESVINRAIHDIKTLQARLSEALDASSPKER